MRTPERRTTRTLIGLVAGLSLAITACGSDSTSSDDTATDGDATETTIDMDDDVHTDPDMDMDDETADTATPANSTGSPDDASAEDAEDVPERIVSLSPTHTEILFAIGAGDQVVAVDDQSNFPAEALELPNELSGFEPNIEAIATYEPDLVVVSSDLVVPQLDELGITNWVGSAATGFDDVYAQIEQLGAQTGHIAEAAELVGSMQTRIDALVADAPELDEPLTYYHELDPSLFSVTSDTFIGQQYELLGLDNIAGSSVDDGGNQYPQLNAETVIAENPDLIFLADTKCCGESAATVAERDGWADIAAVQNGNVIEMDDDIASRWGPRIVDYMEAIAAAVEQASVPA